MAKASTVTVEIPVELIERARKTIDRMAALSRRGKHGTMAYWAEVGELESTEAEMLGFVYKAES